MTQMKRVSRVVSRHRLEVTVTVLLIGIIYGLYTILSLG